MSDAPVQFRNIRACVFDAYGTLFDVHSAAGRYAERIGPAAAEFSQYWRTQQLQLTWLRSLMRRHADFWRVTADSLEAACRRFQVTDPALRSDLLNSYLRLEAYPEAAQALRDLREKGLPLAILSNGTTGMIEAALKHSGLEGLLDAVLSVEEVGVFKPDPRVYELAGRRFGLEPSAICFVSSNGWDAAGAAAFGLRTAWINRLQVPADPLPAQADVELKTLAELPGLLLW